MSTPSRWLRKKEAAEYMGVSTTTIDRWVREGRLRKLYLPGGKTPRFRARDLDAAMTWADDKERLEGNPEESDGGWRVWCPECERPRFYRVPHDNMACDCSWQAHEKTFGMICGHRTTEKLIRKADNPDAA